MKVPVFFDVDNTLIDGQTQEALASFLRRKGKVKPTFLLKIYSWFLLYKMGVISEVEPMMKKSYQAAEGIKVRELENIIEELFHEELKPRIFNQAVKEIQKHQKKNNKVILVSNSAEPLVKTIRKELNLSLHVATSLEVKGEVFTGNLQGPIVYGEKKVKAIEEISFNEDWNLEDGYAYTDHHSDLPLLQKVKNPIAVNPNDKLKKEAQKNNWPIYQWKKVSNQ